MCRRHGEEMEICGLAITMLQDDRRRLLGGAGIGVIGRREGNVVFRPAIFSRAVVPRTVSPRSICRMFDAGTARLCVRSVRGYALAGIGFGLLCWVVSVPRRAIHSEVILAFFEAAEGEMAGVVHNGLRLQQHHLRFVEPARREEENL